MWCETIGEAAGIACAVEGPARRSDAKMIGACAIGEEPVRVAVDLPYLAQHDQRRFGEGEGTLLVAFADNAQQQLMGVNGGNGQADGLADTQAASVDKCEAAAVDGLANRGDQAAAVRIASNIGKRLRLGWRTFFSLVGASHSPACSRRRT